jgi:putative DNA primase/helicase
MHPLSTATIPQELKERSQWVLWNIELREDKETKIPYQSNGRHARANDPSTWTSFKTVCRALENNNGFDGVGFVFSDHDDYAGLDFDNCVDPITGEIIDPQVKRWVRDLDSYTEYSQSLSGLHVIIKGRIPGQHKRQGNVEMYHTGRYFCMTGQRYDGTSARIESRQEALNELYSELFGALDEAPRVNTPDEPHEIRETTSQLKDSDVIRKAAAAKNGDKFMRLFYDGDTSGYQSQSEAELALCGMLRFWCGDDTAQIDRIFRRSLLYRAKWDERHGAETYGNMTITKTLAREWETYGNVSESISRQDVTLCEICEDDTDDVMLDDLTRRAKILIEAQLGANVELGSRTKAYTTAWRYLHTGKNAFLKYCTGLVFDYHALDRELTQTTIIGMTRARYTSVSDLLHLDCTGGSGAGKNDLLNRVGAIVPPLMCEFISTVTPTALHYETIEKKIDDKGHKYTTTNKERYKGKIIFITEVADAAGYAALKALAETDESFETTHMATVNGESVKMTITGPRCVITTSVEGVNDPQVKRRFIHTSVSNDTIENKLEKLKTAEKLLLGEKDIRDDPRLSIVHAGIELIFSANDVVFEKMDSEAEQLLKHLNEVFVRSGYGITNIKQFYTLCQCSALWKRFERGYTRIEVADVQEAWFLLATFERETITKTSEEGIKTLKAIGALCEEYDAIYESNKGTTYNTDAKRPTRQEIVKESHVSQAHVYRLLRTKQDEQGKLGELLELGYVANKYEDGQTVIELTDLGTSVLKPVPKTATLNEGTDNERTFTPVEPISVGKPINAENGETEPLISLEEVLERYETAKENMGTM